MKVLVKNITNRGFNTSKHSFKKDETKECYFPDEVIAGQPLGDYKVWEQFLRLQDKGLLQITQVPSVGILDAPTLNGLTVDQIVAASTVATLGGVGWEKMQATTASYAIIKPVSGVGLDLHIEVGGSLATLNSTSWPVPASGVDQLRIRNFSGSAKTLTAGTGWMIVTADGNPVTSGSYSIPDDKAVEITLDPDGFAQVVPWGGEVSQAVLDAELALKANLDAATTTVAGLMSAIDKTKLDGVATGAEANVQADWNQAITTDDSFIQNKPTVVALSSTTPVMDGTAAVGTGTTAARADHVHASDTTKANTDKADVTASTVTLDSESGTLTSPTIRVVIDSSVISLPGSVSSGKVRVTFASSTSELVISNAYIGIKATSGDVYDFASTPVQLTFAGVTSKTITASSTAVSDYATLSINPGDSVIVAYKSTTGTYRKKTTQTGWKGFYKNSVDEASTVDVTGYTEWANAIGVNLIEVKDSVVYATTVGTKASLASPTVTGTFTADGTVRLGDGQNVGDSGTAIANATTIFPNIAATATSTIATTDIALRASRPGTTGTKWGNTMDVVIGSHTAGINASTQVDFRINNGGVSTPDITVLSLKSNGEVLANGLQVTSLATTGTPVMDGTAALGTATTAAHSDHVHGSDTSRASAAFNGVRVGLTAAQSVATSSLTTINWTSESYDTTTYHDNTTNNSRMTAPATGYYSIGAKLSCGQSGTGSRALGYRIDAGADVVVAELGASASSPMSVNFSEEVYLTSGQYVEIRWWQSTGGAFDVTTASYATMSYLGS